MESSPFEKPFSAGVRSIWMIKFNSGSERSIDFYIPSPFANEWMSLNQDDNLRAQDMLREIQNTCYQIKDECKKAQNEESIEERLGKTKEIFKDIKNLDGMMKHFRDFMQQFYKTKPEDEKPQDTK